MPNHAEQLAQELNLSLKNVQGAIDLIDAGNTIPFIARYRKEATGSMDDQVLRNLGDRLEYLRGLDKRKEEVTGSIEAQNAMTPELQAALAGAKTLAEVEDIYRPYKPKRKTRASIARARGLQPLADATLKQDANFDPQTAANDYLNEEVPDAAAALAGAQDIIAETISDDAHCRAELRRYYHAFGMVKSVKAKDEDSVYTQYYDYTEPVAKIPGHRILALDRGEREGFLKVSIAVEAERAGGIVAWMFARKKTGGASAAIVEAAALDAYSRLIHPSLENELRAELTAKAAEGAITVFGENLRQLLLQPPIRGKTVMGLDPGYRMGCKVAVVDGTGKVTTPTDTRTKRQKGKDYPLAEVSGLKKGWAEQADAFSSWLEGKTPDEVKKLKTDADGKPADADLLSGCTIAVDRYRDAVVRACENAQVLGAARGDTVKLGVEVAEMPQGLAGTDDKDAQVQAKITLAVVTMDENARVTSAIGDMTEPELSVSADGTVSAPREPVYTKNELGDRYGMRSASALGKEWYEHSAGWCGYLKGKNAVEIGKLSADGTDADLKALCTISVTDLQKAVLKAMAEQ